MYRVYSGTERTDYYHCPEFVGILVREMFILAGDAAHMDLLFQRGFKLNYKAMRIPTAF